ncbi:fructoselysine 6-kinase [Paenibacillus sp. VCA1]|uniref:fructoselysine 6-kinase n=1 Tax=Paenibacillus sp. VCA1 TaxID=3039148 RepID=UPI0028725AF9|nr:fructoselysine 6-kinase [Paenibacillus sp. VCA1]MDR9857153.1 fructoselysine 6-kinase [Paenibacillus sp. VCA1]
MRIVAVGDNCMDVYQSTGKAYPGGNAVNVAVYLAELGADTAYIGWVGTDRYGETMVQAIQEKGVDASRVSVKEGRTAVTFVEMAGNERKLGDYEEGVMAGFSLSPEDLRFTESFHLVHSAIWGHADACFAYFKEKGLLTSFDFADKLDHELLTTLTPYVDYPFLSYTQDDGYIRGLMKKIKDRGAKLVVATLGENGSLAYDGKTFYKHGIVEVEVVDTLGAGDSFIAGFIYGVLKGFSVEACLEQGAQRAAKTISYFAAW